MKPIRIWNGTGWENAKPRDHRSIWDGAHGPAPTREEKRARARALLKENGFLDREGSGPARKTSNPERRQSGFCHYCEKQVDRITADHIVPKSLIERNNTIDRLGDRVFVPHNLIDACGPCNGAKADMKSVCDCGKCRAAWDSYYRQVGGYHPPSRGLWIPPRLVNKWEREN